jgi:hypothetical protein
MDLACIQTRTHWRQGGRGVEGVWGGSIGSTMALRAAGAARYKIW